MAVKDFEHYVQNPDELPTDPAEIDALLAGAVEEQPGDADEQDVVAEAPSEPEQIADQVEEETPAPISSRDGKHTIPYAVLQTERERRVAAEQVQQELQQRIAEIESQLAGNKPSQSETPSEQLISDDSIAELVEDFPHFKPVIEHTKRLEAQLKQYQERFDQLERVEISRQEAQAREQAEQSRKAVDENPTLRYWESKDPERWQAAIEADKQLRTMPINQKLSLPERFAKAVAVVEAIYGPTELPADFAPPKAPPKDITAQVKKVVDNAQSFTPKTLGDMPGGMVSEQSSDEALVEQSPAKLFAMMDKMTPAQINELLAKAI